MVFRSADLSNSLYVSSHYYMCVLRERERKQRKLVFRSAHLSTSLYVSSNYYMCVLIETERKQRKLVFRSAHTTICVLILLHMCPHTTTYVFSFHYVHVLILLFS